ncbi:hypothetical protein DAI22_04g092900 [Oryza sativa Japonica Group]|nr:hypothetical protein DAI22_04g092900 [Oryza sativa Japonica Group]
MTSGSLDHVPCLQHFPCDLQACMSSSNMRIKYRKVLVYPGSSRKPTQFL